MALTLWTGMTTVKATGCRGRKFAGVSRAEGEESRGRGVEKETAKR